MFCVTHIVPIKCIGGGGGGCFPGVKQPGRETDQLPPSSAEVKNTWSCTSIPLYVFMAWCLIKHRIRLHGVVLSQAQGQLYFYFTSTLLLLRRLVYSNYYLHLHDVHANICNLISF